MPRGLLDDQKIDVVCPKCGQEHAKTIAWIKAHRDLTCSCGTLIKVAVDQFLSDLERTGKSFRDLCRALGSPGKRRR